MLLLVGCKATKPEATTPLWRNVDTGYDNALAGTAAQAVDTDGNSWQAVVNDDSGHSLRLVDADGVEIWRIALPLPAQQLSVQNGAATLFGADNSIARVSWAGALLWHDQSLPADGERGSVQVASDGSLVAATIITLHSLAAVALDAAGAVRWSAVYDYPAGISAASLAQTASGDVLVLTNKLAGGYQMQTISSAGVFNAPQDLDADIAALIMPALEANDSGVIAVGSKGAVGLADADQVDWQYRPTVLNNGAVNCSALQADGLVCAYLSRDYPAESTLEWVANDGTILRTQSLPLSDINRILPLDDGRVLLTTVEFKVSGWVFPILTMGIEYTNYRTTRLWVLDGDGNLSQPVVLPPQEFNGVAQRSLDHLMPIGYSWVTTDTPYESVVAATMVGDVAIVAGHVLQLDPLLGSRARNNLVTGYAVLP